MGSEGIERGYGLVVGRDRAGMDRMEWEDVGVLTMTRTDDVDDCHIDSFLGYFLLRVHTKTSFFPYIFSLSISFSLYIFFLLYFFIIFRICKKEKQYKGSGSE